MVMGFVGFGLDVVLSSVVMVCRVVLSTLLLSEGLLMLAELGAVLFLITWRWLSGVLSVFLSDCGVPGLSFFVRMLSWLYPLSTNNKIAMIDKENFVFITIYLCFKQADNIVPKYTLI